MKPLKLTFILIFLCAISNISAQPNLPKPVADSLWHVWTDEAQSDTNRLKAIQKYTRDGYLFTKPDSAFYYAQLQYEFAKVKGLQKDMAKALNTQGVSFYFRGDYAKAIDYYTQSLKIKEDIGDKQGIAASLNNIGSIYKDQGDYAKAIDYYTQSLKIKEDIGDKQGIATSLNNIGIIYKIQGDYAKAIDYYTQSLKISEEMGDKQGIASSLNNIGIIYSDQGDYAKAIDYFTQSLKIREEIGDKQGIAVSLNNIGSIYKDQGDYAKAIDYYTQSLKIKEDIGDKQGIATSLNNIGIIYKDQGDYAKAIDYYTQSLKIFEEIGDKKGIASIMNNIGNIYKDQGDYAKAIDYFTQSLKICEEIGDKKGIAGSLGNIGINYKEQGNYTKALEYNTRSLTIAMEIGVPERIKSASRSLYLTNHLLKNGDIAKKHLSTIYNLLETEIQTNYFTLSENEKQIYFSTMEEDFGLYHDFALHYQDRFDNLTDTSYNIALQNKGLTLKSSTAMRTAIQNSGDTTLINQYEDWLSLKRKIANSNSTDSTYKELTNQANEEERELVKNSTVFSDFDKVKNLKWQDVQSGLKPNEAAIEFVHFKSEIVPIAIGTANPIIYAALIIKKESQYPEMIRLCTETELKEILGVFQGNNLSFVKGVYGTKSKAEKALYEKIWQPLEKHLDGIQNIYYSPTGLLHKVSFAAISKDNNVFLCDNYQLNQQSSTGKVALPTNVLYDAKDEFLLLGGVEYNSDKTKKEVWNYLPGTKTETENIQAFLKKKKHAINFYVANDASEDNFKAQANKANVLHISTHGFFYPDPEQVHEEAKKDEVQDENIIFRGANDPIAIGFDSEERGSSRYANWSFVNNKNPLMRSGLVLAGANDVWQRDALAEGEDGILTAQEVSNLDLRNTKLVVLSACETGLGDIKGSEGVYGLQRAFKIAGAHYLIMSLWQVPDKETSEFMQLFYQNLTKVKDIPKAFNLTQQAMRKKYDPYYWAAFVLIE